MHVIIEEGSDLDSGAASSKNTSRCFVYFKELFYVSQEILVYLAFSVVYDLIQRKQHVSLFPFSFPGAACLDWLCYMFECVHDLHTRLQEVIRIISSFTCLLLEYYYKLKVTLRRERKLNNKSVISSRTSQRSIDDVTRQF